MFQFLVVFAVLAVLAGAAMILGFWPVALIAGGLALLAWLTRRDWAGGDNL